MRSFFNPILEIGQAQNAVVSTTGVSRFRGHSQRPNTPRHRSYAYGPALARCVCDTLGDRPKQAFLIAAAITTAAPPAT